MHFNAETKLQQQYYKIFKKKALPISHSRNKAKLEWFLKIRRQNQKERE